MKNKEIIIEESEFDFIRELINTSPIKTDKTYNSTLKRLEKELKSAKVVKNEDMPNDIVRLHSKITIKINPNLIRDFKIVLPEKSNLSENKLSILSPMGLALYGYAVGDEILWQFPSGVTKIKVLKVE
ncbi:GreA/GreB family elongation factor [Flavobacterium pectinovorum]|uniref:Transcription elongation factor GreAB n=1 Tax=Flavobacterium pectinovorum TaxID=29533 RepID=A0A502E219_9FLAO|nr:GreA/GreB family elongation factor [Flavobacterium pectinovorum]TPG31627.1 transcription elongation factor GreAB [Flavobacterium pectinovorum]